MNWIPQFHPVPNPWPASLTDSDGNGPLSEPMIDAHIDLEVSGNEAIEIDRAVGSVAFAASSGDYLRNERL